MDEVDVLESLEYQMGVLVEVLVAPALHQSLEAPLLGRTLLAYLSLKLEGLSLEVLAG